MTFHRNRRTLLLVVFAILTTVSAFAQTESRFSAPGGLSGLLGQRSSGERLTVKGRFILDASKSAGFLQIRVDLADRWHIYSTTQPQGVGAPQATKVLVTDHADLQVVGPFTPDSQPKVKNLKYVSVPIEEYGGHVVWSAPIQLKPGVDPTEIVIQGEVDGQICEEDGVCLPLSSVDTTFRASFDESLVVPPSNQAAVAAAATGSSAVIFSADLPKFILYGFFGGMILNLMPCVLPVIGLKIMSFATQAGQSRGRIILLNLTYVAGIVTVFIGLAVLAAFFGWRWGDQFQKPAFGVALAAIVFVFGLSFLGIWEIPIPGFVGSGNAMQKAEGEGVTAAYLKGILTTVLATPCGAPLVGSTLAWAATQSAPVVFATFISMGLGMGAPYIATSVFPSMMSWIPKPGVWMDTFKQIMGFVLLGTVVWILSFIEEAYVVPTVALLFVLWAACWWINRTPLTAPWSDRIKSYVGAALFAGVVGTASFWALTPGWTWPAYSDEQLALLQDKGVTVLVDFTADY